ncbi:MAG: redoxin domain-containing protein [Gemmataceae bacterium]|nr:redoxin domain-containing protein [Gemmataceae bacterium]
MTLLRFAFLATFIVSNALTLHTWAGDKDRKSADADKKDPPKKAQTKEIVINGKLTNADLKDKVRTDSFAKTFTYRMVENQRYQIDMVSTEFDSYLRLENPAGDNVAQDDDGGGFPNARMIYVAPKNGDYTIVCTSFGGGDAGKFTLIVRDLAGGAPVKPNLDKKADFKDAPIKLDGPGFDKKVDPKKPVEAKRFDLKADKDGKAVYTGQITADDGAFVDNRFGRREKRSKLFIIQAEANKTYRIDLASKDFDAYLFLLDDMGKIIAQNDDNGESLDSRLVQKIEKAGKYTIVATSLGGQSNGEFTLTVRPASADEMKEANLRTKSMAGVARRLDLVGNTMEVKGKLIDGKDFDLKNLKGKVVLVDFWATWCGPCVQEIPHVKSLYEKYNKRGFEVVGISLDNTEDAVRKFNETQKLPWGSIFNDSQKRGESLADYYGVQSIPLAILVDRDGRVVSLNARGPELTRLLEQMFVEKK